MRLNKKIIGALLSVLFVLLLILLINVKSIGRTPELNSLSVSAAYPGETITLYGNYFGGEISRGRVFINEKMVFSKFIKSWDDNEIELTLTDDFKSGMITVINMFGESNSYLITSLNDVPKIKLEGSRAGYPYIESVNYTDDSDLKIIISGRGFGTKRESSSLLVTGLTGDVIDININSIISWNDDSIVFNLPYGIDNIILSVVNNIGISNDWTLHNNNTPAILYMQKDNIIYHLKQKIELNSVVALNKSFINLFVPCVYGDYNQKDISLHSESGIFNIEKNTYDHFIEINESGYESIIELETEVTISSIEVKIRKDLIGRIYNKKSPDYLMGFKFIPFVDKSDKDIYNTASWIVRNTNNRLTQVESIINWVLKYIKTQDNGVSDSKIGFKNRAVSEFGLVNLACSMLRSIGIPTRIIKGITVSEEVVNYQWLEFYLPNGGWIPLDLLEINKNSDYNIGFLENNRIGFSKGVTKIEYQSDKYEEDFYALQNCISNSQGNIESYEAIWHNIEVK
ncbi:MAG: transglutaminase-like domain-containing protein [Spirochaetaceae bacterium]